ncbi:hypothetical protein [Clostridium botulinum]|nr:hypothetical protein [Clostridium botulinum]
MSRCYVEYNGKWACFSSIVDDFITEFMIKSDCEEWRISEHGKNLRPMECNVRSMKEVAFSIRLNKTHYQAVECLRECGLSEEESEKLFMIWKQNIIVLFQKITENLSAQIVTKK